MSITKKIFVFSNPYFFRIVLILLSENETISLAKKLMQVWNIMEYKI